MMHLLLRWVPLGIGSACIIEWLESGARWAVAVAIPAYALWTYVSARLDADQ
jgi:hypothetical protein